MAKFLTSSQRSLLVSILNRLIPGDGTAPSAGQTQAADYIDGLAGSSPPIAKLFSAGLRSIEAGAARAGHDFVGLDSRQQDEVLREIESGESEFFENLLMHVYNGYYSDPQVVASLGLEARPPQPRGHQVDLGDFSSLRNVETRGQAYREV